MKKEMQKEIEARLNDNNWSFEMACGVVSQKRRKNRRMLTVSTLSSVSAAALAVVVYSYAFSTQNLPVRRGVATIHREAPRKLPAANRGYHAPSVRGQNIVPVQFHGMNFGESRDVLLIDAALRSR